MQALSTFSSSYAGLNGNIQCTKEAVGHNCQLKSHNVEVQEELLP